MLSGILTLSGETFVLGLTEISRQDPMSKCFLVVNLEGISVGTPGYDVRFVIFVTIFEQIVQ